MRIEITAGTFIKGVPASPGEIREEDEQTARLLISYGRARVFVEKTQEQPTNPIPVKASVPPDQKKKRRT